MYQQPSNHSYSSTDSLRWSSNNPFRQASISQTQPRNNFDEWVDKNKQLLDLSSDDEEDDAGAVGFHQSTESFGRPSAFPPTPVRADSDSSINYARYVLGLFFEY